MYGAVGQCKRSEACYIEALRICPDYPDALFGLATVTQGKRRLRYLKALLRVQPKHLQGKLMMGQCREYNSLHHHMIPRDMCDKFESRARTTWGSVVPPQHIVIATMRRSQGYLR